MKRLLCAVAVMSMVLTGCGSSACEELADAVVEFEDKITPCGTGSGIGTISDSEILQCEEELDKNCTDSDKTAISNFAACLTDVPTCISSNPDPFLASVIACSTTLESKLTPNCNAAASVESLARKAASLNVSR